MHIKWNTKGFTRFQDRLYWINLNKFIEGKCCFKNLFAILSRFMSKSLIVILVSLKNKKFLKQLIVQWLLLSISRKILVKLIYIKSITYTQKPNDVKHRNFDKWYDGTKEYLNYNHLNNCNNVSIDVIYNIFIKKVGYIWEGIGLMSCI